MRSLAADLDLSKSSVHNMLKKDMKLSKIMPKFVPRILTAEQENFRKRLCEENLEAL